jgi:hypothetical protein
MTLTSFLLQVQADAVLQLALIAMFFLSASLIGGIGRILSLAIMSFQFARMGLLLGSIGGIAAYLS